MASELLDEKAIFNVVRQIGSPDARAEYLQQACGTDSGLRERVQVLLRAYEEQVSFLESPPPVGGIPTIDQPASESPGAVIGPYKLIEQIGEGGMGSVWMAQQTEPVRRLVAVKLIKAGMDSRQIVARFEAERQAVALMDHANIARVLDAGTSSAGRPYFVMDLVRGVPITRYCDEHRLTPRQRLELFLPVCQAVQHAHQKGIIHRDLKPSNVLVALYDGRPVPKVIDFGVAKAAGQSLTDKTLVTGLGAVVGTLEYMSPEQAETNQLDIDTRSDIYSLGVLLYELLAGSPPFTRKELEKGDLLEMLRVIREKEPTKPSAKMSTAEGLPTLAANRGTEPAKLTKLVRGELDWIVMKALEKDRNRRYETASAFAQDVQRYLADEPVLACPPSVWYRFRKFARRNRTQLALGAALVLLLLGAGAFAWYTERQATERRVEAETRERDEQARLRRNAEAVAALLQQCEDDLQADRADRAAIVLEAAERRAAEGGAEKLAARTARCRDDLRLLHELDALDESRLTSISGGSRAAMPDAAQWRPVLAAYGMAPGGSSAAEAAGRVNGSLVRDRVLAALDLWLIWEPADEVRAGVRALLRAADPDPYREAVRDAVAAKDQGAVKALAAKPEALAQPARFAAVLGQIGWIPQERRRAVLTSAARARPEDLWLLLLLGSSCPDSRAWAAEQARWFQAAVAARRRSAAAHNNLGTALYLMGDLDGAIAEYQEAIRLGRNPKLVAACRTNLGVALRRKGNVDGAIAEYQEALRLDPMFAHALTSWGLALAKKKDPHGAIAKHWEAIKVDPKSAQARAALGDALAAMGELEGAITQYKEAIRLDPKDAASYLHDWGRALSRKGNPDGALARYEEAIRIDPNHARAHTSRAAVLWEKREQDAAMAAFLEGVRLDPEDAHTHGLLGVTLSRAGDRTRALVHLQKAILLDPEDLDWRCELAFVLGELGRPADAITQLEAALRIDPTHFTTRYNLAAVLRRQDQLDRALPLMEQLATEMEKDGFRHEKAEDIVIRLIDCHERLKHYDQAETWRRKWVAAEKERHGGDSPRYAVAIVALGRNLLQQEKWADAEAVLRECLGVYERKAPNTWIRFYTLSLVGGALFGQKKYADAEPLLLDGYFGLEQREKAIPVQSKVCITEAAQRLVQLYDATAKKGEAAKWQAIVQQRAETRSRTALDVGDDLKLEGKLDGQTPTLLYEVKLTAGKAYVIDMVSPDPKALDPYLVLHDDDGKRLAEDDDSGGNLNARITYRALRDGVYRIYATTSNKGRGAFTLTVREKK
jgi:serine/threonine protein kinase/Tfp pilus assembly protein PilF